MYNSLNFLRNTISRGINAYRGRVVSPTQIKFRITVDRHKFSESSVLAHCEQQKDVTHDEAVVLTSWHIGNSSGTGCVDPKLHIHVDLLLDGVKQDETHHIYPLGRQLPEQLSDPQLMLYEDAVKSALTSMTEEALIRLKIELKVDSDEPEVLAKAIVDLYKEAQNRLLSQRHDKEQILDTPMIDSAPRLAPSVISAVSGVSGVASTCDPGMVLTSTPQTSLEQVQTAKDLSEIEQVLEKVETKLAGQSTIKANAPPSKKRSTDNKRDVRRIIEGARVRARARVQDKPQIDKVKHGRVSKTRSIAKSSSVLTSATTDGSLLSVGPAEVRGGSEVWGGYTERKYPDFGSKQRSYESNPYAMAFVKGIRKARDDKDSFFSFEAKAAEEDEKTVTGL